jgi:FkbM family methyltransferase
MMIYYGGWYDYDEMHFLSRYLQPGDAVVDVGANIGIYTLLAASLVGDGGKVLSFEPGRVAFARLEENVRRNRLSQVEAICAAISERPGRLRFFQRCDLTNRLAAASDEAGAEGIEDVTCITLDTALAGTRFAFGKIDIEGAETMAFRGAQQILHQANPPVWLLEMKDRLLQRYGSSAKQLATLLHTSGYDLAIYDADHRRLTFPHELWQEEGNILAIHRNAVDVVRSRVQ